MHQKLGGPLSPISGGNTPTKLDLSYSFLDSSSHNNGNVASITNNLVTNRSQNFSYDSLNRLATAQTTSTHSTDATDCWAETYNYDPWGNLLKLGADPVNQSAYTGCSQESGFDFSAPGITSTKNQIATSGYAYDAAGNMTTTPGAGNLVYDAENHLLSSGGVTYTYDGDGKRVQKSSGTLYWYDPADNVLLETNTAGNWVEAYLFFDGKRVGRWNGVGQSGVQWYITDHLGSSRYIFDGGANGEDISDFYPFGGERSIKSQFTNTYKFTGKERDPESGLDNFTARFDSSTLGRFMSPDPENAGADMLAPQGWNAYSYVLNNPLRYVDPFGLYCAYLNDEGTDLDKKGIDNNSNSGECNENGGYWIEGSYLAGSSWLNINVDKGTVSGLGFDAGGNPEVSTAGAMDSNARGAWTQTFAGVGGGDPMNSSPAFRYQWSFKPGLRGSGTFSQCMESYSENYSIGGAALTLAGADDNQTAMAIGNTIGGNMFLELAYGGSNAHLATASLEQGLGSPLTYGRRSSDIMSMNLAGKGGLPRSLSASGKGLRSTVGKFGKAMSLDLTMLERAIVDATFVVGEGIACR